MDAREIAEECDRRSIWILSDRYTEEPVLYPSSTGAPPAPDWLCDAARDCGGRLFAYLEYSRKAKTLIAEFERRLRAICRSKRLRRSPLWERYMEKIRQAYLAEDLELLITVLRERELHVVALFGDQREERRRRRYMERYG